MNTYDLGPQSKGDDPFTRKARLLQSWYRAAVLREPCGFGPSRNSETRYGNMLVDGETTGANFLTREIFEYARTRARNKLPIETIDGYRLFNNMLSSQPMCFNLFVPLKHACERGEGWVAGVFAEVFPQYRIESISKIELEFIPHPVTDYINDKSAFDAFVEFRTLDGSSGVIGIETKYTDMLGKNNPADLASKKRVAEASGCFTVAGIESMMQSCPQIVRNYLLTESYRLKHGMHISHSLILSPKADVAVVEEMEGFKRRLTPTGQSKLSKTALEDFTAVIDRRCPEGYRDWIGEFFRRYLNFEQISAI